MKNLEDQLLDGFDREDMILSAQSYPDDDFKPVKQAKS